MTTISNIPVGHSAMPVIPRENKAVFGSIWTGNNAPFKSKAFQSGSLCCSCSSVRRSTRIGTGLNIQMALVNERLTSNADLGKRFGTLAYDLVQGALVRWSSLMDKSVPEPPTAVLVHGILGCRKNWGSFVRRLAKSFPMWQFLVIDLRCHGESASMKKRSPHTVASAALDVLKLVSQLRITPRVLVGHSFGGKVVMSMVEQAAKPLARPVKIPSKQYVLDALMQEGFSKDVAQWVVTNLRQNGSSGTTSSFSWIFDLEGISELFHSYEETNLWKFVEDVPRGVHVNFLKAERSLHRWALEDIQRIHAAEEVAADEGAGVQMHVLEDAGHWVHTDNPDGLFKILTSSFEQFRA